MWHCQVEPAKVPLPGDRYLLVDTIRVRTTVAGLQGANSRSGNGLRQHEEAPISMCWHGGRRGGRRPLYSLCCPTTGFIWPFALLAEVSGRKGAGQGWKRPIVTSLRFLPEKREGIM